MTWGMVAIGMAAWAGDAAEVRLRVLEYGSGRPVPEAEACVEDDCRRPDGDGWVTFELPPGPHQVVVQSYDHRRTTLDLLVGGEPLEEVLRIERYSWHGDEEVLVLGRGDPEASDREVLDIAELRRVPGSFGDPVRALQSLPSVARPNSVEGTLAVRGAEGLATETAIDEVPVPYLFHFLIGKSVISPSMISEIEFYPGGVPTRYGDTTQALVNARTHHEPLEKGGLHGDLHADLLELGSSLGLNLGDGWTARVSGRGSWLSTLARLGQIGFGAVTSSESGRRPAGMRIPYADGHVRVDRAFGVHRFYVTAFGAEDAIEVIPERLDEDGDGKPDPVPEPPPGAVDPNDLLRTSFVRGVVGVTTVADGWRQDTWVAGGADRQRNLMEGVGVFGNTPQNVDMTTQIVQVRHTLAVDLAPAVAVREGVDARVRPTRLEDLEDRTTSTDVPIWVGPFAELQLEPGPLYVAPGVRAAFHELSDTFLTAVEPRLTTRLELSRAVELHGFVGRFSQAPTLDRYAGAGDGVARLLLSDQASIGIEASPATAWGIEATLYGSLQSDVLVEEDVPALVDKDLPVRRIEWVPSYDAVSGRAYGGELMVRRHPLGEWFGWVAVAVGRSERRVDEGWRPADYDTPFTFTGVVAHDFPHGLGLSGRVRLGSGRPYTPLEGVYMSGQDGYYPVAGETNSERYPFFQQVDLRLDETWVRPRSRWTAYLDVFNVTNAHNPLITQYDSTYSERVVTAWIPIVPTVGVEVAF